MSSPRTRAGHGRQPTRRPRAWPGGNPPSRSRHLDRGGTALAVGRGCRPSGCAATHHRGRGGPAHSWMGRRKRRTACRKNDPVGEGRRHANDTSDGERSMTVAPMAQGNGPDRYRRAVLPRKRTTALAKAGPVLVGGGPGRNSGPVTAAPPKGKTLYWKWIASASLGEGT